MVGVARTLFYALMTLCALDAVIVQAIAMFAKLQGGLIKEATENDGLEKVLTRLEKVVTKLEKVVTG